MRSDSTKAAGSEIRARRTALRRRFGALYEEVLAIVTRHDPIGIADVPGEYEPEVGTILPRLQDVHSEPGLRNVVHEEFVRWFGATVAGPEAGYDKVAREIWVALQRWRAAAQHL